MPDCIFCKIISGDIPSWKVFEDEWTFAFMDVAKDVDGHILVVPKKHAKNIRTRKAPPKWCFLLVRKLIIRSDHCHIKGRRFLPFAAPAKGICGDILYFSGVHLLISIA